MSKKFLKHDANILFISLAVILLISFIGFGIFFQTYISSMQKDHSNNLLKISNLKSELEASINKNTNLNSTIYNLTSKYKDQKEEVKNALKIIENDKLILIEKLNDTNYSLTLTSKNLELTKIKLTNVQNLLNEKENIISTLELNFDKVKSKNEIILKNIKNIISDINSYISNNQTTESKFKNVRNDLEDVEDDVDYISNLLDED